jgi:hypothetical protein
MGDGEIMGRAQAQVHGQRVTVEEMKQLTRHATFDKTTLKHLNEVRLNTLYGENILDVFSYEMCQWIIWTCLSD